jgi:hypothetical protein
MVGHHDRLTLVMHRQFLFHPGLCCPIQFDQAARLKLARAAANMLVIVHTRFKCGDDLLVFLHKVSSQSGAKEAHAVDNDALTLQLVNIGAGCGPLDVFAHLTRFASIEFVVAGDADRGLVLLLQPLHAADAHIDIAGGDDNVRIGLGVSTNSEFKMDVRKELNLRALFG